ncbi:MAG: T9SS type A sorting domain-containing protein, partial [candidate division WOR-3 bacterium]
CMRNLPGAYYLLERTFGSSITGIITDSITNQPIVAEVRVVGYYDSTLTPRLSDSLFGRYRRILNPGTYSIQFLKQGYDTITINNVVVLPGIPTILNVKMKPLGIEESANLQSAIRNPKLEVYPNPFKNHCVIKFQIPNENLATCYSLLSTLKIYDVAGRVVKSFNPESCILNHASGIIWSGDDDMGRKLPSGVYFIDFKSDEIKEMEKVIMLR